MKTVKPYDPPMELDECIGIHPTYSNTYKRKVTSMVTAWVTKYALTQGIFKVEGNIDPRVSETMLTVPGNSKAFTQHFHGNEWHRTLELAIARAEEMRRAKIKSLEKQLTKVKKIAFEVKE